MKKEDRTQTTGDRIRLIRGKLTQNEFAEQLGVGRTSVIRYEADERLPDAEFLIKLNVLYKIQPLWLLIGQGDDVSGVKLTPRQHTLLTNFDHSDEAGKKLIESTASLAAKSAGKKN